MFSYLTIDQPSAGLYKEKGSKFMSFAIPVENEADIKRHLEKLRKEYYDARHHCFAWIIGPERRQFRAFDDGEPNHSAGDPILGQIRSKNITNVLVVVVRYFGGTKLGVGGLITAYKTAAEDALLKSTIVEKEILRDVKINFDYAATPDVMRLIKEYDLQILSQDFTNDCAMDLKVSLRHWEKLREKLDLLHALGKKINFQLLA